MKKYLLFFILLIAFGAIYFFKPFDEKESFVSCDKTKFKPEDFVSINGKRFNLNGKDFYPIIINYLAGLQTDGKDLWPCPAIDYTIDAEKNVVSKDSAIIKLRADFNLIKKMGFNAVRVCRIGEGELVNDSNTYTNISVRAEIGNGNFTSIIISNKESYKKYFDAISILLNEINNAGLKAILLTPLLPDVKSTETRFKNFASYFKNEATIMAYDLFNEPLYFDHKNMAPRTKEEVCEITKRWDKILKENDSNHLSTIGLEGIREVFAWDPNILKVDFLSLHPYEYEPEQVRNEIYWYGKYITKPWIIGETSLPADNDSVTYVEQKQFAKKTLKQSINCGSWGYSWWQYKDVDWHVFHPNFMGVITRTGKTAITKDSLIILGTPKPLVEEFKNANPSAVIKDSCMCLKNYYNYTTNDKFILAGRVVDNKSNQPIEGAVILAWNDNWSHSYHTITKSDGSFELTSHYPFYHWIASATNYSITRADILPDTAKISKNGIPTINIGVQKLDKLFFGN